MCFQFHCFSLHSFLLSAFNCCSFSILFFSFVLEFSCVLFWSSHMYCYWNKPNESQMYNNFYKEWFKIMSFKPSNFLDMMIFIEVNDYC